MKRILLLYEYMDGIWDLIIRAMGLMGWFC